MGQAKNRGTREQRIAEAKARKANMKPPMLICNNCKAEIKEVTALDTNGMRGINAVFAGICPECTQTTWAISGDRDAAAALMAMIGAESGTDPSKAKFGLIRGEKI